MNTALGRYEICGKLAEGGMATVYLGRLRGAEGFTRTVALKLLKPEYARDTNFVDMFIDEANLVAKLAHPNIVQIYELGKEDGQLFIAMEMLFGQSLADVWAECRSRRIRLRGDMVAWIGARLAEGLHHAHELSDADGGSQNLVHRDVNPANIFITYDGHVKVIDFGLVKARRKVSQTAFGVVKGKLAYLSPEQVAGQSVDRRSDVFSLGATLWELSTDERLFKRDADADTINAVREAHIPDATLAVADYPSLLWLVLRRALAREPDGRHATAQELARDLDGVARAQGSIIQAATLAELMGELFGQNRGREMAWLRGPSLTSGLLPPSSAPVRSTELAVLRPAERDPTRAAERTTARHVRSPYLIPTSTEPSIPPPNAEPAAPLRYTEKRWFLVGFAAALLLMAAAAASTALLR